MTVSIIPPPKFQLSAYLILTHNSYYISAYQNSIVKIMAKAISLMMPCLNFLLLPFELSKNSVPPLHHSLSSPLQLFSCLSKPLSQTLTSLKARTKSYPPPLSPSCPPFLFWGFFGVFLQFTCINILSSSHCVELHYHPQCWYNN